MSLYLSSKFKLAKQYGLEKREEEAFVGKWMNNDGDCNNEMIAINNILFFCFWFRVLYQLRHSIIS